MTDLPDLPELPDPPANVPERVVKVWLAAAAAVVLAIVVTLGVVLPGDSGPPPTTSSTTSSSTTTTTRPPAGRPGPETTGPTTSDLRPVTAEQVEAMMVDGAVIEGVAISGGNVDVRANDVTVRNFTLDAGGTPYGFRSCGPDGDCRTSGDQRTGFVAEDGFVTDVASAAFWGRHATFRRLEVSESQGDAFKPVTSVRIEDSWWHHLGHRDGAHADGVQFQGGCTDCAIVGNFCDMAIPTLASGYHSNACLIVSTDQVVDVEVSGNWLDGGNFTMNCGGQATVNVHDNRMGGSPRYGTHTGCPTWARNG